MGLRLEGAAGVYGGVLGSGLRVQGGAWGLGFMGDELCISSEFRSKDLRKDVSTQTTKSQSQLFGSLKPPGFQNRS